MPLNQENMLNHSYMEVWQKKMDAHEHMHLYLIRTEKIKLS